MMNARKGGSKNPHGSGGAFQPLYIRETESPWPSENNPSVDRLSLGVSSMNTDDGDGGAWESAKKSKNRSGNASNHWASSSSLSQTSVNSEALARGRGKSDGKSWAQVAECKNQQGRGNYKPQPPTREWLASKTPHVPPPLQNGWQWASRNGPSSQPKSESDNAPVESEGESNEEFADSDDDFSDEYDSDVSVRSFETRKNSKWFKTFFEVFDGLSVEEVNEPSRQWHCPACQGGPGAIDWYRGLLPLITHAKTKGSTRVKLHRELAELLEEEVQRKGSSVVPIGEVFGKWKGLSDNTPDHEILWPPLVVIMNTLLDKDDNDKWTGMGNQELLEYFRAYDAKKARHSYGPQGHRGMSILIFDSTAMGYLEAERLHKHFVDEGTDREAWERRSKRFYPGGQRQLYGFLATKEDMDSFNKHSQGKSRLKFEMKSYKQMVVEPMKQMNQDNQQLMWYKNKAEKQQLRSKTLEKSLGVLNQKLRQTNEENKIVRLRSKEQHEENKAEMDQQDLFFREQMDKIHRALEEKERIFEKLLQEERSKAKQEQDPKRVDLARVIDMQEKEVEEFLEEREKLERAHEDRKTEMRRRHLEEEISLEKGFDGALTKLMDKYKPGGVKPPA